MNGKTPHRDCSSAVRRFGIDEAWLAANSAASGRAYESSTLPAFCIRRPLRRLCGPRDAQAPAQLVLAGSSHRRQDGAIAFAASRSQSSRSPMATKQSSARAPRSQPPARNTTDVVSRPQRLLRIRALAAWRRKHPPVGAGAHGRPGLKSSAPDVFAIAYGRSERCFRGGVSGSHQNRSPSSERVSTQIPRHGCPHPGVDVGLGERQVSPPTQSSAG